MHPQNKSLIVCLVELETKAIRRFPKISQSGRRSLQGPSPGCKRQLNRCIPTVSRHEIELFSIVSFSRLSLMIWSLCLCPNFTSTSIYLLWVMVNICLNVKVLCNRWAFLKLYCGVRRAHSSCWLFTRGKHGALQQCWAGQQYRQTILFYRTENLFYLLKWSIIQFLFSLDTTHFLEFKS